MRNSSNIYKSKELFIIFTYFEYLGLHVSKNKMLHIKIYS